MAVPRVATLPTPQRVDAPFDAAIVDLCRRRSDVIVLTADLSKGTDLMRLPRELPNQFVQVGMAEQNLMGVAGGLAKAGFVPVATSFAVYATRRAYDAMVICMGTGPSRGVVVGFTPGITNPNRVHHQAIEDLSMMRAVPNACVIDPADATEFIAALNAVIDHPTLVYLRGHRRQTLRLFPEEGFRFEIGAVRPLRESPGIALISTGHGTQWAYEASQILDRRGVEHAHLHVPTLKPIDSAAIRTFCAGRQTVVTVENHSIVGGLGTLVCEALAEVGMAVCVRRIGVPDTWAPGGSVDHIRRQLGLDAESIAKIVEDLK